MKKLIAALACLAIFSMHIYADELLIGDFTQDAPIAEAVYLNDVSLLENETMFIDGSGLIPEKYDIPCESDVSKYEYINILIYSETETEDDYIQFRFDTTVKKGTKNMYYVYKHKLDYSGFKTVTVALSDFTKYNNVSGVNGWASLEGKVSIIRENGTKSYCENSKIYLDRMWFSTEAPAANELVSCSVSDNASNVLVNNSVIDFEFTNNISKRLLNSPVIEKNGAEVNCTVSINENRITFDFGDKLDFKSVYNIEIPENSIVDSNGFILAEKICLSFETSEEALICSELTEDSGEIKGEIMNFTSDKQSAVFYVSAFGDDNSVISCYGQTFDIAPDSSAKISAPKPENGNVQAFVLDITAGAVVCAVPFGNAPALCEFENSGAAIDDDAVTLGISANPYENCIFTVHDKDGEAYFASQLTADGEGNACVKFVMNKAEDKGKVYNVSVYYGGQRQSYSYYFISDRVKSELLDKSNADKAQQKQIFDEMYQAYGVSEEQYKNGNFDSQITLLQECAPFDSYDDIIDTFNIGGEIMDKLNASQWTDAGRLFENTVYESMLFRGVGEYEKYKVMDNKKQPAILKETFAYYPFSGISQFRAAFKKAYETVEKTEDSDTKRPASSGGGGGGGGGGTRNTFAQITDDTAPKPSENTKPDTKETFTDLDGVLWAKESVNRLLEKGVISKDIKYRPDDFVTREEFAKMMCLAFNIPLEGECDFADADKNQWYYGYIGAMVKIGAVKGYDNNTFGIGDTITRQDMAVIAKRLLDIKGIASEVGETGGFADESMISDYALGSVYAMKGIGVISGMEDNTFAPLDNATRAQTAVITDRLMNIADKGGDGND